MYPKYQAIVICLKDSTPEHVATYVQASRRRFASAEDAQLYCDSVAASRNPTVVQVPFVKVDQDGYPTQQEE